MPIKVLEIHHHATRINADKQPFGEVRKFYSEVLGLGADPKRPFIPGIPGYWINVGDSGQIHLVGGDTPSPVAKRPDQDPAAPHVALAVVDIVETKAELQRMGVPFWSIVGVTGPENEQVFVNDPCGNMIELHQFDRCRCRASARQAVS